MKIPLTLVLAHTRRTWLRSLLTTGSVFVAILIFGGLRTFIVSMENVLHHASPYRLVTGSAISLFAFLPRRLQGELERMPHVRAVGSWTWYGGIYLDDSPEHLWARFGVDPESLREIYGIDMELSDEAWKRFEETRTGCIIGKDIARDEELTLGSRVPLQGNLFPGNLELEVVGIYGSLTPSFDQRSLFMHWDYMNEVSKQEGGRRDIVSTFTLVLDDPRFGPEVAEAVDASYESSSNRTLTLTERLFQAQFTSMWGNIPLFFTVLGTVVLLACLMVTANTLVLNARERVSEVGVLKTLGFGPGAVATMTLAEGLLLCLAGGGLALAVVRLLDGATLVWVPATVPASTLVEGLGLSALLGVLSGIVPAWISSRLDIVDSIRRRA